MISKLQGTRAPGCGETRSYPQSWRPSIIRKNCDTPVSDSLLASAPSVTSGFAFPNSPCLCASVVIPRPRGETSKPRSDRR